MRSDAALRGHYKRLSVLYKQHGERSIELKNIKVNVKVQIHQDKKASHEYLDPILADSSVLCNEAASLRTEAQDIKTKAKASIVEQQRKTSKDV